MSSFSFTQNPIARAEKLIQKRPAATGFITRLVRILLYVYLTGFAIVLLLLQLFMAIFPPANPYSFYRFSSTPLIVFFILVLVQHFAVMFRTLATTVAALERERKNDERWDTLMMTAISGREIVLGKWWAIMRANWRDYAWLTLWRAAAVTYLGADRVYIFNSSSESTLIPFLIALLMITAFTMINLPFTTACAVYAGIAFRRAGLAAAIMTRILLVVVFSLGLFVVFCQLSAAWYVPTYMSYSSTGVIDPTYETTAGMTAAALSAIGSLFDNGSTLTTYSTSAALMNQTYSTSSQYWVVLLAFAMAILFYFMLTGVALLMAQGQAERFGALRPRETKRLRDDLR
jgi:hypothetical protein